ncbi:MAG: HXXEE domain-containing protein [Candidatus Sulfotelmatobacter sp.]
MLGRLIANWVYGGFLAGLLLLLLAPVLVHSWPAPLVATFLCLPVYMIHQYEEHDDDKFRRFVNQQIGKGEVLSPLAVFIINVPGVWGVIGISLALTATVGLGFGLIAAYLVALNGIIHVIHAVITRGYNPGLGTAILLFFPLGGYGIAAIQHAGAGTALMHAVGAGTAVAIHAAIIVHVFRQ